MYLYGRLDDELYPTNTKIIPKVKRMTNLYMMWTAYQPIHRDYRYMTTLYYHARETNWFIPLHKYSNVAKLLN